LARHQWKRIEPHLPTDVRGVERADDRRVISGIVHVLKSGCRWRDCPSEYGPPTTIYNHFVRWARRGVWQNLFRQLAGSGRSAVENATLLGTVGATVTGSSADNVLVGNTGSNALTAMGGDDRLYGMKGNDLLDGGNGDDYIDGGAGNDSIRGGSGADIFHYGSLADGGTGEKVLDFGMGDAIDVHDLLSGIKGYDGADAFAAGYVGLSHAGSDTLIQIDAPAEPTASQLSSGSPVFTFHRTT
jgi:transposase